MPADVQSLRVAVLSSTSEHGDPYTQICDPDLARFLPQHRFEYHFIHKPSALAEIEALARTGVDVFLNMCDGAPDQSIAGVEVVHALERLGLCFTGADSAFYSLTRERMKDICRAQGLTTPAYAFASSVAEAEQAAERLRFPLFVKHHDSYASVGLGPSSRVEDRAALRAEVERMLARFGRVLIEEFIAGDELSALILEQPDAPLQPRVLRPIRVGMPAGSSFIHYDLKARERSSLRWQPIADEQLVARVEALARRLFLALGGVSYGRCDLRLAEDGELHVLELNANCAIFCVPGTADHPSIADAIMLHDPLGPAGFLAHVLATALARRQARPHAGSAQDRA